VETITLSRMYFSAGALSGRTLKGLRFENCQFQPTSIERSSLDSVEFHGCEFERLEISREESLSRIAFSDCEFRSLVLHPDEEHLFNPVAIVNEIRRAGASIPDVEPPQIIEPHEPHEPDDWVRMTERFLRSFLRSTHIDEDMIRLRMGKYFAPRFMSDVLPVLLEQGVLEEIPWRGRGVQRRFKLGVAMSDVNMALERCNGDFEHFIAALKAVARP
jgi:hypothetical protein